MMDLSSWWRSLSSRFGRERAPMQSPAQPNMLPWAETQKPWTDQEWLRKAKNVAALRIPLGRIVEDTAAVQWRLFRMGAAGPDGRPTRSEVLAHPLLDLWNNPNPHMTGISFRELWQTYYEVVGRVPIRIEYAEDGVTPVRLWPIPPHHIKKLPSPGREQWEIVWRKQTLNLELHEMIWITRPDPEDPYGWGCGVAQAVKDDVSQISWMNQWSNNFFRQGAHIGKIVGIPGLSEANRGGLQNHFLSQHTGVDNAHKTLFIGLGTAGGQLSVVDGGPAHKDLDWVSGQKFLGDRIRQTLNVPPEVVGDVSNSNRATAEAADYIHQSKNVKPRVQKIAAEIAPFVRLWFGEDLVLEPDDPVRETSDQRHAFANDGWRSGAITRNEWRRAHNDDPLPEPLGDQFLVPVNMAAVNPDGSSSMPSAAASEGDSSNGASV